MHTFPIPYSDTAVSLPADVHTSAFTDPAVTQRFPAIAAKCTIEQTPDVVSVPSDSHNSPH
jgi:hypothetical protein